MSKLSGFLVAAAILASGSANAVVVPWTASMDQSQETTFVVSVPGASGSASGTIDTVSFLLTWDITFSGLSGALTGLHFHGPALPGSNAGVLVNIGNISGLTSPNTGSATTDATFVSYLQAGQIYINAHTQANPGGEIRGQVEAVPLPAALPLMGGAIAALGLIARRQRT